MDRSCAALPDAVTVFKPVLNAHLLNLWNLRRCRLHSPGIALAAFDKMRVPH
jgi:hypothetical protein